MDKAAILVPAIPVSLCTSSFCSQCDIVRTMPCSVYNLLVLRLPSFRTPACRQYENGTCCIWTLRPQRAPWPHAKTKSLLQVFCQLERCFRPHSGNLEMLLDRIPRSPTVWISILSSHFNTHRCPYIPGSPYTITSRYHSNPNRSNSCMAHSSQSFCEIGLLSLAMVKDRCKISRSLIQSLGWNIHLRIPF